MFPVNFNVLYSVRDSNSGAMNRIQTVPAKPFGKNGCIGIVGFFYKPCIWNMIIMNFSFLISDTKINGHLYSSFSFENNFILPGISGLVIIFYSIVNIFCGFDPLVKKPVKVHSRTVNDGISEILRIRM